MSPATTAMILVLLKRLATLLGGISGRDFDRLCDWIDAEAKANPDKKGWQKMDAVLDKFRAFFGDKDNAIAQTIVQLAYTWMKLKGIVK